MSDEPKKRSRAAWIAWALIAALVLYPLSIGPADLYALNAADPMAAAETVNNAYAPIVWLCNHSPWATAAAEWYVGLWI
jgi:hypothetical protein